VAPGATSMSINLDRPKNSQFGDYSCAVALQLAKSEKRNPRDLANALVGALPVSSWLDSAQVAGAGFINLKLKPLAKQQVVNSILTKGTEFGRKPPAAGATALIEFVSANPTGPLHVGHGRQAALGDSLAAVLETQGQRIYREFYYNDAGSQIQNLALSVEARARELLGLPSSFPEDGYRGDYIIELAKNLLQAEGGICPDLESIRKFAVRELRAEQDLDLKAFGVAFDNFYLESSLYTDGRVDNAVESLKSAGVTYERDGALWLKTTEFGDDKDRVMRKSDGTHTYFVPDVAYHITKWERGYSKAINIQGSDHHGTIARVRAGLQACNMGIPKGYPDYILHKMVTVMRSGEEVKISKRAGSYVTLRDLIDEAGKDATRFFLISRKADSEFVFDLDLARSKSEENPVYYVQYAHARVCSVLEQWRSQYPDDARDCGAGDEESFLVNRELSGLSSDREMELLQTLDSYPETLEQAACELAPHQIAFYLRDLAGKFHGYYNAERFLVPDQSVRIGRLALAVACRRVLKNGLALIGVSAPEKM
jgi:arginyl-tRNA synthetase